MFRSIGYASTCPDEVYTCLQVPFPWFELEKGDRRWGRTFYRSGFQGQSHCSYGAATRYCKRPRSRGKAMTATGQRWQPSPHRGVQPFGKGGIAHLSSHVECSRAPMGAKAPTTVRRTTQKASCAFPLHHLSQLKPLRPPLGLLALNAR